MKKFKFIKLFSALISICFLLSCCLLSESASASKNDEMAVKKIIGVMGPGLDATEEDLVNSYEIGKYAAQNNYVTLTGGIATGVMNEALRGAKEYGGLTIGILPNHDKSTASKYLDIPICTDMGQARNYINILSSDIIVACGISSGTSSEISLALRMGKLVILTGATESTNVALFEFVKFPLPLGTTVTVATPG